MWNRHLTLMSLLFSVLAPLAYAQNNCQLSLNQNDSLKISTEIHRSGLPFQKFIYNEFELGSGNISTHGNYSATLPKKSFKIELASPTTIFKKGNRKSFFLIGLAEDPRHIKNHFSLQIAQGLGLFPSEFSFCKVKLNNSDLGLYLLIERPEDALRSEKISETIAIARRRYYSNFDIKYTLSKLDKSIVRKFLLDTERVHKRRQTPFSKRVIFKKSLNFRKYYDFLALNRILMNGDYTDELFWKVVLLNKKFYISDFSSWDFDDIGQGPHNGLPIIYKTGIPSLIYSGESELDVFIAYDQVLYQEYLERLSKLTEELELSMPENMKETLRELKIYKTNAEYNESVQESEILMKRLQLNIKLIKSELARQKYDQK